MQKCRASFEWRALNLASEVWDGGFQPWIFWIIEPSFWKRSGSCFSFPGSVGMNCGFWVLLEASLLRPYPAYHLQFWLCHICKTTGHPVLHRREQTSLSWSGGCTCVRQPRAGKQIGASNNRHLLLTVLEAFQSARIPRNPSAQAD